MRKYRQIFFSNGSWEEEKKKDSMCLTLRKSAETAGAVQRSVHSFLLR